MSQIIHVLLTGGVGSRFWPLSRKSKPKQYLPLFSGSSLFEKTVNRNSIFSEEIMVVGNKENQLWAKNILQNQGLKKVTHIIETTPRNTAPAIAFAALSAQPNDILFVTPADHLIEEGKLYQQAVSEAVALAEDGALVTFGITPTRPETGYGYIEFEQNRVISFREKPDFDIAEEMFKSGNFLWNSGMFCFKAGIYLQELKKLAPEVYLQSLNAFKNSSENELRLKESLKIPSISIDYAVLEKSENIKVVKSDFQWSDMGSFDALYDYLKNHGHPIDRNGNMSIGTSKFTAFAGLNKCIFVETEDANLILSKEAAQDVKEIYSNLALKNSSLVDDFSN